MSESKSKSETRESERERERERGREGEGGKESEIGLEKFKREECVSLTGNRTHRTGGPYRERDLEREFERELARELERGGRNEVKGLIEE